MNTQKWQAQNSEKKFRLLCWEKSTFWKRALKRFVRFFFIWNDLEPIEGLKLVSQWQEVKVQFWSILGVILPEMGIN